MHQSSTHTRAPPRAAPAQPSATATPGKKSPEKSCDACPPDCLTPIHPGRFCDGTARIITRLVVGLEIACAGPAIIAATTSTQYVGAKAATTIATAVPMKIISIWLRTLILSARLPNHMLDTAAAAKTTVTINPNWPAEMSNWSIIRAEDTEIP